MNEKTEVAQEKKVAKEQKEQLLKTIEDLKKLVEDSDYISAAVLLLNDSKQSLITGGGHPVVLNEMLKQAFDSIPNFFLSAKQACMEYQFNIDVAEVAKKVSAETTKKAEEKSEHDRLFVPPIADA